MRNRELNASIANLDKPYIQLGSSIMDETMNGDHSVHANIMSMPIQSPSPESYFQLNPAINLTSSPSASTARNSDDSVSNGYAHSRPDNCPTHMQLMMPVEPITSYDCTEEQILLRERNRLLRETYLANEVIERNEKQRLQTTIKTQLNLLAALTLQQEIQKQQIICQEELSQQRAEQAQAAAVRSYGTSSIRFYTQSDTQQQPRQPVQSNTYTLPNITEADEKAYVNSFLR